MQGFKLESFEFLEDIVNIKICFHVVVNSHFIYTIWVESSLVLVLKIIMYSFGLSTIALRWCLFAAFLKTLFFNSAYLCGCVPASVRVRVWDEEPVFLFIEMKEKILKILSYIFLFLNCCKIRMVFVYLYGLYREQDAVHTYGPMCSV